MHPSMSCLTGYMSNRLIPFEETWEWPEMARATGVYINMLIQAIASSDYLPFIQDLVAQRYQQLVISGNINVSTSVALALTQFCQSIEWERESLRLTSVLQRGLNLLKPLFLQIPTSATKSICLGNYIEHLIHSTWFELCPFISQDLLGTKRQLIIDNDMYINNVMHEIKSAEHNYI